MEIQNSRVRRHRDLCGLATGEPLNVTGLFPPTLKGVVSQVKRSLYQLGNPTHDFAMRETPEFDLGVVSLVERFCVPTPRFGTSASGFSGSVLQP